MPAWGLVSLVLLVVLAVSNLWLWGRLRQLESTEQFFVIPLAGTDAHPEGSGLIVISSDGKYGTLVVEELPLLDESQQYQLWLIRDGVRTSGGVFSVYGSGYASLHVRSEEPLISFDSFGVTVEPAGGSPGPTGEKVLGGDSDL
jgi:anti-sigma-K factor RskA